MLLPAYEYNIGHPHQVWSFCVGSGNRVDRPVFSVWVGRVPLWARWLAQDASGVWSAYSVEPLLADQHWYEMRLASIGVWVRRNLNQTGQIAW